MNKKQAQHEMNKRASMADPFLFVIDFSMHNCHVLSPQEALSKNILFNFENKTNYEPDQPVKKVRICSKKPIDFSRYQQSFNYVQEQIALGNSYLVNLTFPTPITLDGSLSELFFAAKSRYKILFDNQFISFSPETFVKISNGEISTYPMKGTIDATMPNAREKILSNTKEMAEHATITDLLRNDLSIVSSQVEVSRYRYLEEINTLENNILQVSSEIRGKLPADYKNHLGDIIFSMLPAGSVSGAPKSKTLEIIRNAEEYNRGFYTGIAGFFDGKDLNSCVLIRFIENHNGELQYKSGGGITSQSIAEEEYNELISKIYVPAN
jgi:para-aminobenzoate synthetase component 1